MAWNWSEDEGHPGPQGGQGLDRGLVLESILWWATLCRHQLTFFPMLFCSESWGSKLTLLLAIGTIDLSASMRGVQSCLSPTTTGLEPACSSCQVPPPCVLIILWCAGDG